MCFLFSLVFISLVSCPSPLTSVVSSGIYLLDMIYIDSAYPASDSIMETEQRSNQMNNLLRVMSDQQMSCNYGRKQVLLLALLLGFFMSGGHCLERIFLSKYILILCKLRHISRPVQALKMLPGKAGPQAVALCTYRIENPA